MEPQEFHRLPCGERRVAITGIGLECPLGNSLDQLYSSLIAGHSACRIMPGWDSPSYRLSTRLACPVSHLNDHWIDRKQRRSMSRVSLLAVSATATAIEDSGITKELLQMESTGLAFASSFGGTSTIEDYVKAYAKHPILTEGLTATTYLKIMPHTCAANIAMTFGICGRLMASGVACASSTQSIGFGYEWIRYGLADRVIAGGADELTPTVAAIFDVLGVTSKGFHHAPETTPRPFDMDRDGIVVGEGAGTLILEDLTLAKARNAKIYAEIVGFHTNNDASHMTNPSVSGLVSCMAGALKDAGLSSHQIDYVSAHAAGTAIGDEAEAKALAQLFSRQVMVSSLKGNLGHLFGAGGVSEIAGALAAFQKSLIFPTLNLHKPLNRAPQLDWVMGTPREQSVKHLLKNSFAFGGVNTSLVLKRHEFS